MSQAEKRDSVYAAIQQPDPLQEQGNMAVNWKEWKSAFDFFLIASGRDTAPSKEKCAIFLHVIGKFGREIFEEFDSNAKIEYDGLVRLFTERFDPKRNVNFERHVFFETYQKDSFDKFLSDLKIKSKSCAFGELRDSMILTQIIRGLKDGQMRERLLSRTTLELGEAVACCRAAERASTQAAACRAATAEPPAAAPVLEEMARGRAARGGRGYGGEGAWRRSSGARDHAGRGGFARCAPTGRVQHYGANCEMCGGWHTVNDTCPASNVRCFRCERFGHFAKTCRERLLREIEVEKNSNEDYTGDGEFCIENITVNAMGSEYFWSENILIHNVPIKFKLDSGADLSVMSLNCFTQAGLSKKIIQKTNAVLKEVSGNCLPIVGYFTTTMRYKTFISEQRVFVLDIECHNLLGRKACTELRLIARQDKLQKCNDPVSKGIGCMPSVNTIAVEESVPHAALGAVIEQAVQSREPWSVVAAELFELQRKHYLIVVDYYSKFFEVAPLNSLKSGAIITHMKNVFGRLGIPQKVVTGNRTQFSSLEFKEFSSYYGFENATSSDGLVERTVQMVKQLFIKANDDKTDWQLALLSLRNTPISGEEYSPAQLLMGRKLRARLPTTDEGVKPEMVQPALVQKTRRKCHTVKNVASLTDE